MRSPKTYSQWMECFDRLKEGAQDEQIIQLMKQGTIEWTRGVAERMTEVLYQTIKFRIEHASDLFQKELNHSRGNEVLIAKGLLTLRNRLALMYEVAQLNAFPKEVIDSMKKVVTDYAEQTQESLEDSAKADRTGRLKMLIKNNPLTNFNHKHNDSVSPEENGSADMNTNREISRDNKFGQVRRRVIIR
ncbi:hypothetical protein [Pseudogracilibacillus auburnensis]|uniref:hypothetical protein n=1 Tax=Pseudogracilibacillus auburnensis TaxID=1494959 RepID=UPI001A96F3DF|nr:hypothetical protein [Pseudogracilibacillus auburnensis]MBO1001866.1 hypothetical protein [Pseudogracilibacillus auburnensis]